MEEGIDDAIGALERDALAALRDGNPALAGRLWERLLERMPDHPGALLALARLRQHGGAFGAARTLLERLVAQGGGDKQPWIQLALVCNAQRDEARE